MISVAATWRAACDGGMVRPLRRFGYLAKEIATVLGYTSHTSAIRPIQRIEPPSPSLARILNRIERQLSNHESRPDLNSFRVEDLAPDGVV